MHEVWAFLDCDLTLLRYTFLMEKRKLTLESSSSQALSTFCFC